MQPTGSTAPDKLPDAFTAPIDQHRLFEIKGPDTNRFLQGQVTCDVQQLTHETSLPGAACTPKGRAYALFRLLRLSDDCVMMRLPANIAEEVTHQLSKYLAFFKAEMTPASDWQMLGIVGRDAAEQLAQGTLNYETNAVTHLDTGTLITTTPLPDGTPRFEYWTTSPAETPEVRDLPGTAWHLTEIQSGLTSLYPETISAYIPLNLNLQAIDGVSFQKGCYTGQEVIARMHHLGQLKKSLFRLEIKLADRNPVIGDTLVDEDGGKLGAIIDTITDDAGTTHSLAVLSHKVLECRATLAEQPGARVRTEPMGYSVEEQKVTVDNS